jgi:hypothetical protein
MFIRLCYLDASLLHTVHQPVLFLDSSGLQQQPVHGLPVYESLCCTYACPSTRAFVLHLDLSVYNSLCCICACLSTRALWCTCLQQLGPSCISIHLFWFASVYFVTCSKQRSKPKQTEKLFDWFHETNRKTTETDLVSVLLGSNRHYFLLFRTPTLFVYNI